MEIKLIEIVVILLAISNTLTQIQIRSLKKEMNTLYMLSSKAIEVMGNTDNQQEEVR